MRTGLASNGSRHDDAEAAVSAVLRAVEARAAPAGAVVAIALLRPTGVLVANAARDDVDHALRAWSAAR